MTCIYCMDDVSLCTTCPPALRPNYTRPPWSLVGFTWSRLTVVGFSHRDDLNRAWLKCRCVCGKDVISSSSSAGRGSFSCGCHIKARMSRLNRTHGGSGDAEFGVWKSAKARCFDRNSDKYKDYGARGITMSESWLESYSNFLRDMGRRPTSRHQLERIDNDGPYSSDNCRWATAKEQANNRRSTVKLVHNGEEKTLLEWSLITGLKRAEIYTRIRRGCTVAEALSSERPPKRRTGTVR